MNSDEINVCKSLSHGNGTELRRGPWTLEEDNLLIQYITVHGEGKWNTLSKFAGLNRTGKSCRLRWLNYLKPDIKRGNLTPQEQLLILELHSKLGNRWSKIAQHLPGRTDNEIKNYWRTRVQKQARQLKIDSNSKKFLEAIKNYWMPRLLEKIEQNSSLSSTTPSLNLNPGSLPSPGANPVDEVKNLVGGKLSMRIPEILTPRAYGKIFHASSGELAGADCYHVDMARSDMQELVGSHEDSMSDCHVAEMDWLEEDFFPSSLWDTDELWQLRKLEDEFVV